MTAPRLKKVQREEVTLLTATPGPPGPLKERTVTYAPGATWRALVTPLTAEQAVKAGLTTAVNRWRVRLPRGVVVVPDNRLRFRGKDWKALSVVAYQSYTLVVVEGV